MFKKLKKITNEFKINSISKLTVAFKHRKKNIKNFHINFLKQKKFLVLFMFFCMLLSIMLIIYNAPVSRGKLLREVENSLLSNNSKKLSKYIRADESKVLPFELEPLIRYYNSKPEQVSELIYNLNNFEKNEIIKLKSKDSIFGQSFYLDIKPAFVKFKFNVEGVEASIGKNKISTSDLAIKLIPGLYDLNYKLETDFGDIEEVLEVLVLKDTSELIDVNATNINIYSNFNDATIFINDINTGITVDKFKDIGLIPTDKGLTMHLERQFPWGKIKSKKVDISNEKYYKLDIIMVNDKLNEEVKDNISEFYNSTFEALNNKNIDLILYSTEEVKSKVYKYIEEKSLIFTNNYEISDLKVIIEKSDFKFEDQLYKGSILTRINYKVFKKMLPFLSKQHEQQFLIQIEFKENKWHIKDIQSINVNLTQ